MKKIAEMSIDEIFENIGIFLDSTQIQKALNYNQEAIDLIAKLNEENMRDSENVRRRHEIMAREVEGKIGNFRDKKVGTFLEGKKEVLDLLYELQTIVGKDEELQINDYEKKRRIAQRVFNEFGSSVNKEYLVAISLYNLQKQYEDNGVSNKNREQLVKRAKVLEGEEFDIISWHYDKSNDIVKEIIVINARELARTIKRNDKLANLFKPSKKKKDRLDEIDRKIGLRNIAQLVSCEAIHTIISCNKEIGYNIASQIYYNLITYYQKTHPQIDVEQLRKDKTLSESLEKEMKESDEYINSVLQAISANVKHIDIDKLLLVVGFRVLELLEDPNNLQRIKIFDENGEGMSNVSLKEIQELLIKIYRGIAKETKIKGFIDEKEININYSAQEFEGDLQRFVDGRYISKGKIQEVRRKILEGETDLENVDESVARFADFSKDDFLQIMRASENNIIFLVKNNVIKRDEIYENLELLGRCPENVFLYLANLGLLNEEEIINLFETGIICAEYISKIDNKELIETLDIQGRVKELCIRLESEEEGKLSVEDIEKFNKFSVLYKALYINGKEREEIDEASLNLVSSFEEDLSSSILKRLYQFGIISLEVATDWGMDLNEMLLNSEIKPTDLKALYQQGIIKIEEIKGVLLNKDLPYEEKLDLIYSTFDSEGKDDTEMREKLVNLLGVEESYRGEGKKGSSRTIKNGTNKKTKEFVTDSQARWKLISLIDKDYSRRFLPKEKNVKDGHRVFLLPNLNKVVIERMLQGKRKDGYKNATYILGASDFFENIDDIIKSGAIDRTFLFELSKDERADRIIHSKHWGKHIKGYFDINDENERYEKSDIEEIDKAIEAIERSRRER